MAPGYRVVPATSAEKNSCLLHGLGTLVGNQLTIDIWDYFWTLNSITLVYISIFMPVPHRLDYCNFEVNFEIGKCEYTKFGLFQDRFIYSGNFALSFGF